MGNIQAQIAIMNLSASVTDQEVQTVMQALQLQISRDLAKVWNVQANLYFVPSGQQPLTTKDWILQVLDKQDPNVAGRHTVTDAGYPLMRVFNLDDQAQGLNWTVTASHELLNALVNPFLYTTVSGIQLGTQTKVERLYLMDVCGPVQADSQGYGITVGTTLVTVSDFVTPSWFAAENLSHSAYDFMQTIVQPFTAAAGGYYFYKDQLGVPWSVWFVAPQQVKGARDYRVRELTR